MNIMEIEKQIIRQLHELPMESAEEVLDFAMSLEQRRGGKPRPRQKTDGKKHYTIVELGGTEPDLMIPPRRRAQDPL
uniref:DUF2281 domain-containing protein n=1 Tax=Candidatus Kentrum sp. SD TaxID=2126332 RepID=A0A450YPA4_9GAMM|nr:MAG: hypothetical protein BECKSD772F_GA0070984_101626 [Candidatus Kentron sp. SD]VFK43329.1 MAG: hypothetical protein BECKSD772E_GA0070983_102420 [Candidatus Kentron sp. SD]